MNATVITTGPGESIQELPLREPMELLHDAPVQERHDGEPAAEHEQPCGREVQEYFPEHPHGCRPSETRREPRWPRRDEQRRGRCRRTCAGACEQGNEPRSHENPDDLSRRPG